MATAIAQTIDQLGAAFEEFKRLQAEEMKAIKAANQPDPTLVDQLAKVNARISELDAMKARLEAVETKANRPGATAATEAKSAHRKAFDAYARKGVLDPNFEAKGVSAYGADSTEGGLAVPEDLDRQIGEVERVEAPLAGMVSSITASNETYEKLMNQGGATVGWVGETDARGETVAPKLASVKPAFGEIYAMPGTTQRALDDLMFNVEAWLASEVGFAYAQELDKEILTGLGTAGIKIKGILSYALAATADATRPLGTIEKIKSGDADDFTPLELFDVIYALKPGYRRNASWIMNTTTVAKARKWKDTTTGQFLWQPGLQAGQPSSLLGFPVVESANVDAVAAGKLPILFGNLARAYSLVRVGTPVMIRDNITVKGRVLFYTARRMGGGVMDSNAIKVLSLEV